MRLTIEWIKEFVPVEAAAEELAERLTMAGLEVEETAESEIGPVLDIKVTPNRGDCLSVIGVARELAAVYGVELKAAPAQRSNEPGAVPEWTSVSVEDRDLCPRYAVRIVRNVRNVDSPAWMQARLIAAGMRPISGIVDVTNYVMLETGQPLHAFDYDTLNGRRIVVRRAHRGEKIVTIDGEERLLRPHMLVICDSDKAVAVAGVMGGHATEMQEHTKVLLLESAHFDARSIRRTSRELNLRTEASYRFERVVDPSGVVAAADRACDLIDQLGMGDVMPGAIDEHGTAPADLVLPARPDRVSELLGYPVTAEEVETSLRRLGFARVPGDEAPLYRVPTSRPDVTREIDLVEEVGRVLGYDRIPERLPMGETTLGGDSAWSRFAGTVRVTLAGLGLREIVSHSLLAPSPFEDPRDADARIAIRNALSAELSGLRRSLLPGLVDAAERNARRGEGPLWLFEVGRIFRSGAAGYEETTSVAALVAGPPVRPAWTRGVSAESDFYTVRGFVERLSSALNLPRLTFRVGTDPRLHPGRRADVLLGDQVIGCVGELQAELTADLTVRGRIAVFELSLDALRRAAASRAEFVALSPFPSVTRDVAPRMAADVPYASVEAAVKAASSEILAQWSLVDVYSGAPLPDGVRSMTLSLTFRAADRTLGESEVEEAVERIRVELERTCAATFAA